MTVKGQGLARVFEGTGLTCWELFGLRRCGVRARGHAWSEHSDVVLVAVCCCEVSRHADTLTRVFRDGNSVVCFAGLWSMLPVYSSYLYLFDSYFNSYLCLVIHVKKNCMSSN